MLGLGLGLNKGGVPLALYKILIKNCGLLSYHSKDPVNSIWFDEVGKNSVDAVLARSLDGNGQMYCVYSGLRANENTIRRVRGNFNSLTVPSNSQRMGSRNGFKNAEFQFGISGGNWYIAFGNDDCIGGVADTNTHDFEIRSSGLYIDGNLECAINSTVFNVSVNEITTLALSDGSLPSNFTILKDEIDHNGQTYRLNTSGIDSGKIQLVDVDNGDAITGQLFLAPAEPTSEIYTEVSLADEYGRVTSDGVSFYRDESLTDLIGVDIPIPVDKQGLAIAWIDDNGVARRPHASEVGGVAGRIKTNLEVVNGDSLRFEQKYGHIFSTDENGIWTDRATGTNKTVLISSIPNITNNQSFYNGTLPSLAYYSDSLIEPCLSKAKKLSKLP